MKLLELSVQNVRGLQDLHLRLNGKNIVVWGPNGAGKSCVVDAIEFLFTGRISRLVGEGTAGISLARHGPHIDHEAKSAFVTAIIQLEGIDHPVELSRCIDRPDELVCPEEARAALDNTKDVIRRGGVVLTRRDILRYVAAEAGKRADEIEKLLHLRDVDDVRSSLIRARTELNRNESEAKRAVKTASAEVNVTLGLTKYSNEGLLKAVNDCRKMLGGESLDTPESSKFKDSLAPPVARNADQVSVNINHFRQAIQNIRREAISTSLSGLEENDEKLRTKISELKSDPGLLTELARLQLTEHAYQFVDDATVECPVCGASWPEGNLKTSLEEKIVTARAAEAVRKGISESAEVIAMPARTLKANLNTLTDDLRSAKVGIKHEDLEVLDAWLVSLDALLELVADPVDKYLESGLSANEVARLFVPKALNDLLDRIEKAVQGALPKPAPEQTAWDTLTRLQESVRVLENRGVEREVANLHSKRSKILLAEYEKARDSVLGGLYSRIADRFVEFYRALHSHEGDKFGARLRPQGAGLTFEVDFMGRGTHPPHALHSEGHQDSMGVCLFLALNEELVKGSLGLLILDDVMMSVDSGHRKDVCRLLAEQFSECQFVITTHDRTWAKQLKQERVVEANRVVEFTGWTVETGPNTHLQLDLWETIEAHLDQEDVDGAAFRLRKGSEDFFEDACNALGAQVTYNSGMQWQLDDWLPAAMDQYRELVRLGRRAASSWSDNDKVATFDELESVRKQVYERTFVEQWSINASVHYSNWANMAREDFSPVVDAFRDLQGLFECPTCGGLLGKVPLKGKLQVAKCPCGELNWNLRKRSETS